MINKLKLISLLSLNAWLFSLTGCVKEEALELQKPNTYDEQYYANLRAYKQTDHSMLNYDWSVTWLRLLK